MQRQRPSMALVASSPPPLFLADTPPFPHYWDQMITARCGLYMADGSRSPVSDNAYSTVASLICPACWAVSHFPCDDPCFLIFYTPARSLGIPRRDSPGSAKQRRITAALRSMGGRASGLRLVGLVVGVDRPPESPESKIQSAPASRPSADRMG